jgi:hypothetical protein
MRTVVDTFSSPSRDAEEVLGREAEEVRLGPVLGAASTDGLHDLLHKVHS